ncbi:hypothetical protein FA95DRAFT_1477437, partial [Auriscalpium vulgare]
LTAEHLSDLYEIWHAAGTRMPSLISRRLWAAARNLKPELVHGWFSRRRYYLKKQGHEVSEEPFEMPESAPARAE